MTSSLKLTRRTPPDIYTPDYQRHRYGLDLTLGSRILDEKDSLRFHAASVLALIANTEADRKSSEPTELLDPTDFEERRAAWMMAKDVVELTTECGGDLAKYLELTGADDATKARVAGFIPLALEAQRLKEMP